VAQGYPPRRSARLPARGGRGHREDLGGPPPRRARDDRPARQRLDDLDAFDDRMEEEAPPWAGPGIYPVGPGRRERRPPAHGRPEDGGVAADGWIGPAEDWSAPPDGELPREEGPERGPGRRAATRARKSRRRLIAVGGVGVVAVVLVVLGLTGNLPWQGQSAPSASSGLVTTFQPGEFQSVPNACQAVSAATLSQYLPGKLARVAQSLGSATQSQCTWTLDARPDFRVLTVTSQAFTPSLLSSGDGSATFGAIDAYNTELQALQNPPRSSKAPKAQLGGAVGLGRDAFTALQAFHIGGTATDEITVVIRDRNVLIIVTMQGQQHGGGFRPVPVATLRAGALAAAHEVLAGIR
jgi:hypothetical protein